MNEFYRETNINKTRKEHCCECCGGKIEVGSKCVNMAGKTDEDYFLICMHINNVLKYIKRNKTMLLICLPFVKLTKIVLIGNIMQKAKKRDI